MIKIYRQELNGKWIALVDDYIVGNRYTTRAKAVKSVAAYLKGQGE